MSDGSPDIRPRPADETMVTMQRTDIEAAAQPPAMEPPVFVVGAERSGTTMFRLMLDGHPDIACFGEFQYPVEYFRHGRVPSIEQYHRDLEIDRIFQRHGFEIDRSLRYEELVHSFLRQACQRSGKTIPAATVHTHFDRLGQFWPNARYIHLVRDGRDVARSSAQMGWFGNPYFGADKWLVAEHLWDEVSAAVPDERKLEVRYHDLVVEPEATLRRVCAFLGVAYADSMFDYTGETDYDRPDPRLVSQWRETYDEHDLRLVEARIGHMLEARGYPLSGLPPLEITRAMKAKLRLQNRIGRLRHRIEEFGFWRIVRLTTYRRLGLEERYRAALLEQNEIVEAGLKDDGTQRAQDVQ